MLARSRVGSREGGERPSRRCAWLAASSLLLASAACASAPPEPPRPDHVAAVAAYARGRVAWTLGRQARALDCFAVAAALDPDSAQVHAQFGRSLLIAGDLARARVELQLARSLDPQRCAGAVDLAELDLRERRSVEATTTLIEVVARQPGDERALQLLHPLLLYLGRTADGLAIFSQASQRRPDLAFVHEARADFLALLGREDEALAGYRRALAIDPRRTAAERKAVHLLERESERLLRQLPAPADPRLGLPAAPAAPLGSG
jgi:tetratricopeptide (TPR) repeat protein